MLESMHRLPELCSKRGIMKAFALTAPGECSVQEVPAPKAAAGEAVVDVERVGFREPSAGARGSPTGFALRDPRWDA
jgi:hypothetical protein